MTTAELTRVVEAVLFASEESLSLAQLQAIFPDDACPSTRELKDALQHLREDYQQRSVEIAQVAGGYRFQVCQKMAPWVSRLWAERPRKYSRALLETLALIAYRQPITRSEIEAVRGVAVSTAIMRTLLDREWIRVDGYREVPGRPAVYVTTPEFLEYFSLNTLDDLPPLAEFGVLPNTQAVDVNPALAIAEDTIDSVRLDEPDTMMPPEDKES